MMDRALYEDDPERVRERLRWTLPGDWFVFETVAADGSLAIGIVEGAPDPSLLLVVYERLSEAVAEEAAQGLARWYRGRGRDITVF